MCAEKLPIEDRTFATQCGAHVFFRRTKTRKWVFHSIIEFTEIAKAAQRSFVIEFSDEWTETDNIEEFFNDETESGKLPKRFYMEDQGTVLIIPKTQDEVDRFVLLPLCGSVPVTYETVYSRLENHEVRLALKTDGISIGMGVCPHT